MQIAIAPEKAILMMRHSAIHICALAPGWRTAMVNNDLVLDRMGGTNFGATPRHNKQVHKRRNERMDIRRHVVVSKARLIFWGVPAVLNGLRLAVC